MRKLLSACLLALILSVPATAHTTEPISSIEPDLFKPVPEYGDVDPGIFVVPTPEPTPVPTPKPTKKPVAKFTYDPEISWYGPGFYGKRTACGHAYTTRILGVAHRSLPCGTMVTFRNPDNGKTITVPVIDRGPYVDGRTWDLSGWACTQLKHCYTGPIEYRIEK